MSEEAANPRLIWLPAIARLLVLPAAALLGLGLIAPAMTITSTLGYVEGWLRVFQPSALPDSPVTYSLIGGIRALWDSGDQIIAGVLFAFSVVFPSLKLATMSYAIETLARGGRGGWLMKLGHHVGKFSMLDVMVVALLVLAVKGMPGNTEVTMQWGLYAFGASVLLSLIASLVILTMEQRVKRLRPQAAE